jgi:hypothetical protein
MGALTSIKKYVRPKLLIISIMFWVIGLALGYMGFSEYYPSRLPLDWVYQTLQLIVLESGGLENPPSALGIARFLLPLMAAQTGISALTGLFTNQVRLLRLRFSSSHVIILGTGPLGEFICRVFLKNGDPVVYINPVSGDHPAGLEEAGAAVISGHLNNAEVRKKVNLRNAACVLAFCEEDDLNISTGLNLTEHPPEGRNLILPCIVHTGKKFVGRHFIHTLLNSEPGGCVECDVVNIYELGARTFSQKPQVKQAQNLLIAGYDEFVEALLVEIGITQHKMQGGRKQILLFTDGADKKIRELSQTYSDLDQYCCLKAVEPAEEEMLKNDFFQKEQPLIIIRDKLPLNGVQTALRFNKYPGVEVGQIIIVVDSQSEIEEVFTHAGDGIEFFHLYEEISQKDVLLDIKTEQLARAFHAHYQAGQPGTMADWTDTDEGIRESNRRLAQKIRTYLKELEYRVIPQTGIENAVLSLTHKEIEFIARQEHTRWLNEKKAQGWKYGPTKDNQRKENPFIKEWELLSEKEKEYNYAYIRIIPEIIANARLQIIGDGKVEWH